MPTLADFEAFDGHHCRDIYAGLPQGWTCPGCGRTPFEILRWAVRFPRTPNAFEDWVGGYHTHHDHGVDDVRFGRATGPAVARFPETVMCEQCNSADGAAKRKLGLRRDFSFAPWEIRRFVTAMPHSAHTIDYEMAEALYRQAEAAWSASTRPRFFD
ncbi:hypothetical protein [Caulobacter sp.]|uniref:hypothetical protein n=1 Tax=Caulobacter sp. TaxID=78 RepID=UPI0025B81E7E|nr:hypothetical protein [Caulobacter sp.]